MAHGTVAPSPVFFWPNGAGYKLYSYLAGTATDPANAQPTYSDEALTIPNSNPVVLNGSAYASVFLRATSYKFVLTNGAGDVIWTQDNVAATPPFNVDLDIIGVAGQALAAGDVVYLSSGEFGRTPGRWYKTNAFTPLFSSAVIALGMVVTAIPVGDSGNIRRQGRLTGLAALTPGAVYFVHSVDGQITTFGQGHARVVGVADTSTSIVLTPDVDSLRHSEHGTICTGRLTLESGVGVSATDQLAKTSLFFTPYNGAHVAFFDGLSWRVQSFSQATLALAGYAANTNYDIFVYFDTTLGIPVLVSVAWASDLVRATALGLIDGVWVQSGATTRRYLGTIRTTGVIGQCEDSAAKRFVWNLNQRVRRSMRVVEATDSWTYTTNTFRQANAAIANQLAFVIGISEDVIEAEVQAFAANATAGAINHFVSIGLNSTTTPATGVMPAPNMTAASSLGVLVALRASLKLMPVVGAQTLVWLEKSAAGAGTSTWYGDNADGTQAQAGIVGASRF